MHYSHEGRLEIKPTIPLTKIFKFTWIESESEPESESESESELESEDVFANNDFEDRFLVLCSILVSPYNI